MNKFSVQYYEAVVGTFNKGINSPSQWYTLMERCAWEGFSWESERGSFWESKHLLFKQIIKSFYTHRKLGREYGATWNIDVGGIKREVLWKTHSDHSVSTNYKDDTRERRECILYRTHGQTFV